MTELAPGSTIGILGGGLLLAGLEDIHRLHEDFGIVEQIGLHLGAEGRALLLGHLAEAPGKGRGDGKDQGKGSAQHGNLWTGGGRS